MYNKRVKECCANCKHCAEVRKRPVYDTIATKICLYHRNTENSYYIWYKALRRTLVCDITFERECSVAEKNIKQPQMRPPLSAVG